MPRHFSETLKPARRQTSIFHLISTMPTQLIKEGNKGKTPQSVEDHELLKNAFVTPLGVQQRLSEFRLITNRIDDEVPWLIQAISCLDLTTLAGDDTPVQVHRLCRKAAHPLYGYDTSHVIKDPDQIHVAAVCVYPARVSDAAQFFKDNSIRNIHIASVATGFPSAQYPLSTKLLEIEYAIKEGANEIDVVINRTFVLTGQWDDLYHEISEMKRVCGESVHMKTILAVGECDSYENIYKASFVAMLAGSDFIKTSTGKEAVNATLDVGIVMCRAIRMFYEITGKKVGFKPAGGIKTSKDAVDWLSLIKYELGDDWINPDLFRIGASSVLDDIIRSIVKSHKKA